LGAALDRVPLSEPIAFVGTEAAFAGYAAAMPELRWTPVGAIGGTRAWRLERGAAQTGAATR
jgi:hypothetical protein